MATSLRSADRRSPPRGVKSAGPGRGNAAPRPRPPRCDRRLASGESAERVAPIELGSRATFHSSTNRRTRKRLTTHPGKDLQPTAGTYCSCVTCIACLRPSPIAPRPSLESHSSILLSSFSFCRRSAHFCLHDLSRIPTNFWRGSLLPLTTYFLSAIFLSLRCVIFFAFCNCLLAQLRM